MLNYYFKTKHSKFLKRINEFRIGSWIDIEEATLKDIEFIAEKLNINLEDLKDSLDKYEIPRLEKVNQSLILFMRFPEKDNNGLHTQPFTVILNQKAFITISVSKNLIIEDFIKKFSIITTTQQSNLLLQILVKIAKEFTLNIKKVNDRVLKQKKALGKIDNEDILLLIEEEEILNQYLSALVPMEELIKLFLTGKFTKQYEEDKDLFEDVLFSLSQSLNLCRINLKTIISLRDSYQIIFSNNLNKTIKLLTSLTIILTLPTIIASFFGMNVALPIEEHPLAFYIILGGTFIILFLFFIIFYRRRWF